MAIFDTSNTISILNDKFEAELIIPLGRDTTSKIQSISNYLAI